MAKISLLRSRALVNVIFLVVIVPQAQNAPSVQQSTFVDDLKLLSSLNNKECKYPPSDVLQNGSPWYTAINALCEEASGTTTHSSVTKELCDLLNKSVVEVCSLQPNSSSSNPSLPVSVFPDSYDALMKTMADKLSNVETFCKVLNLSVLQRTEIRKDFFQKGQDSCTKLCKADVDPKNAKSDSNMSNAKASITIHPVCTLILEAYEIINSSTEPPASEVVSSPVIKVNASTTEGANLSDVNASTASTDTVNTAVSKQIVGISGNNSSSTSSFTSISSPTSSDNSNGHSVSSVPLKPVTEALVSSDSEGKSVNPGKDMQTLNQKAQPDELGPAPENENTASTSSHKPDMLQKQSQALDNTPVIPGILGQSSSMIDVTSGHPSGTSQTLDTRLPQVSKSKKHFFVGSTDQQPLTGMTDMKSSTDDVRSSQPNQQLSSSGEKKNKKESQDVTKNSTITKSSEKVETTENHAEVVEIGPELEDRISKTESVIAAAEKDASKGTSLNAEKRKEEEEEALHTTRQSINPEESSSAKLNAKDSITSELSNSPSVGYKGVSSPFSTTNIAFPAQSKSDSSKSSTITYSNVPNRNTPSANVADPNNIEKPSNLGNQDTDYNSEELPIPPAKDKDVGNSNVDNADSDGAEIEDADDISKSGIQSPVLKNNVPAKNTHKAGKTSMDSFDQNGKEPLRISMSDEFRPKDNQEDVGFFNYFLSFMAVCGIGFLLLHNKKRIIAMVVEGRRPRNSRRRSSSGAYRKLENNFD